MFSLLLLFCLDGCVLCCSWHDCTHADSWSGAEEIVWLSLESSASLQVVPVDYERPFVFRQLIQKLPREVDDPIALELLYTEHKHRVLSGVYVCSERIAVRLAVLALQESFGSFNPYLHRRGFMELRPNLTCYFIF